MKQKHIDMWVSICRDFASVSNCPRAKFGAIIVDGESNTLVAAGYNGYLRGGSPLCGGDTCRRDTENIPSGTHVEIGCVHAEMNAIINCARDTVTSNGKIMFVNGEPCRMCSKMIVQAGIIQVYIIGGVYDNNGVELMKEAGLDVQILPKSEDCKTE